MPCELYNADGNTVVYRTPGIEKGDTFTFTYQNGPPDGLSLEEQAEMLTEKDSLTIAAYWGAYVPEGSGSKKTARSGIPEIKAGAVIGLPPVQPPVITTYSLGDHITLGSETLWDGISMPY